MMYNLQTRCILSHVNMLNTFDVSDFKKYSKNIKLPIKEPDVSQEIINSVYIVI